MNCETGEIIANISDAELKNMNDFIRISKEEMTDKQEVTMKVSKYDNRSKLGKKFTEKRKKANKTSKKSRKINRK